MGAKKKHSFTATAPGDGGNIVVEVPFDVKAVFGQARPPILVTLAGYTFRSTIAIYGGKPYVGVRRSHREAAGVEPGQKVTITIERDDAPREVDLPEDLVRALSKSKAARAAWEALSFTHQKEHVDAIVEAKKPETRVRRIERAIEMLLARPAPKKTAPKKTVKKKGTARARA